MIGMVGTVGMLSGITLAGIAYHGWSKAGGGELLAIKRVLLYVVGCGLRSGLRTAKGPRIRRLGTRGEGEKGRGGLRGKRSNRKKKGKKSNVGMNCFFGGAELREKEKAMGAMVGLLVPG